MGHDSWRYIKVLRKQNLGERTIGSNENMFDFIYSLNYRLAFPVHWNENSNKVNSDEIKPCLTCCNL